MQVCETDLAAIDEVLALLPEIRHWRGSFGQDKPPTKQDDGTFVINGFEEDLRVRRFRDAMRSPFWDVRGHPDWSLLESNNSLCDGLGMSHATLDQVRRWLYASVCADRWADGALAELFEQGRILAAVERLAKLRERYPTSLSDEAGLAAWALSARESLVRLSVKWQEVLGISPAITSRISELDAALIVGCSLTSLQQQWHSATAVQRGFDFVHDGLRYQVKANRPSGKPGSTVTLVGKPKNTEWDVLVWILYDPFFDIVEAWKWPISDYKTRLEGLKRLRPDDLRLGERLDIPDSLPTRD